MRPPSVRPHESSNGGGQIGTSHDDVTRSSTVGPVSRPRNDTRGRNVVLGSETAWNQRAVVATYATRRGITAGEVRVLGECWPNIRDGNVLDIGVGTGRTIPYLAPFAAGYVGIDPMPNMIIESRRQHLNRDLQLADARDLPFPDRTFSFVFFSFCGIDYVDPAERPRILAEVHRVLAPGGVFAYSTHNLASRGSRSRFEIERPSLSISPIRTCVRIARALVGTVQGYRSYRRLAPHERRGDDVAVLNDGAHQYSMLTCYVTQGHEIGALAAAGFATRCVIEPDGALAQADSRARDLYFIADRSDGVDTGP
jgi:SAM-dependent methyltransferase